MAIQDIALFLTGVSPASSLGGAVPNTGSDAIAFGANNNTVTGADGYFNPYTALSITPFNFGDIIATNIAAGTGNVYIESTVTTSGGNFRLSMDGGVTYGALTSVAYKNSRIIFSSDGLSWTRVRSLRYDSVPTGSILPLAISFTTSTANSLFDNINAVENVGGDAPEYRAIEVVNYYAGVIPMTAYISQQPAGGTQISIGLDPLRTVSIANEKGMPTGITFGNYTQGAPLSLGNLGNGNSVNLWVKRQSPGNNLTALNQNFTLAFTG